MSRPQSNRASVHHDPVGRTGSLVRSVKGRFGRSRWSYTSGVSSNGSAAAARSLSIWRQSSDRYRRIDTVILSHASRERRSTTRARTSSLITRTRTTGPGPRHATLRRVRDRHRLVEMGARDRPEGQDEGDEDRPRGDTVARSAIATLPPASLSPMAQTPKAATAERCKRTDL